VNLRGRTSGEVRPRLAVTAKHYGALTERGHHELECFWPTTPGRLVNTSIEVGWVAHSSFLAWGGVVFTRVYQKVIAGCMNLTMIGRYRPMLTRFHLRYES